MDEVAGLAQSMSIAHHQETVDEHMNDNNWRKMVWIGRRVLNMSYSTECTYYPAESLSGKWLRVKEGVAETKLAFDQLTECLEASFIEEWTSQECVAMEQCGDQLKIYDVIAEKGGRILYFYVMV